MKFKKDENGEVIWVHTIYTDRHGREEHSYARIPEDE